MGVYITKIVMGINYLVSCIWFRVAVLCCRVAIHDDVIKWKHISALLALCGGNPSVTGGFPHNRQWRGTSVFSLIWTNGWTYNQYVGDFRYHRGYYDVTVMIDFTHILYELLHWHWDNLTVATEVDLGQLLIVGEVWERINNFIPYFTGHVIIHSGS